MTNLRTVIADFFPEFAEESRAAWRALLAAIFALRLSAAELEIFRRHTGRDAAPTTQAREAWLVVGRRGGKSSAVALIAIYLTCFRKYELARGERGVFMIIAADRKQARVVKRYISGLIASVPMLAALVEHETQDAITLTNGLTIEIHTASFRTIRGYTIVGAVCDEIAFWPNEESANPDTEILNALRPAMATVPGAMLLVISSPYSRRGELYRVYAKHFGKDEGDVLVWQAGSRAMNPTIPQDFIDRAYEADPAVAEAELGAEFRRDIQSFVSREAVAECTVSGRIELPPVSGVGYRAFVDPSGGSQDSMTLAIAHDEQGRTVVDALREVRPPFSPESTVADMAALLKTYKVSHVTGDRYGGEWPREQFRKHGVDYRLADKSKSDLYRDLLPVLNSGRIELLDHKRLQSQLLGLERRTGRGKDSIDHSPGLHDDLPNCVAGVASTAQAGSELRVRRFGR